MLTRIRTALAASRWGDVLAFAAFAVMAIGVVELPWIAPHFVSQENRE